jgi:hypothetical protein
MRIATHEEAIWKIWTYTCAESYFDNLFFGGSSNNINQKRLLSVRGINTLQDSIYGRA